MSDPNEYVPPEQSNDPGKETTNKSQNTNRFNAETNNKNTNDHEQYNSSFNLNSNLNLGNSSRQNAMGDQSDVTGFAKRKFNSFDDTRRGGRGGGGAGFNKNSNYQGNKPRGGYNNTGKQSFNRIPTINSQRGDGGQSNNYNNNNNSYSDNRGGRGRYNNNNNNRY